jgi:hypothetical protein
MEEIVSDIVKS